MGLNRFVGTGRLTKDVEFKENTSGGKNMARFTVAINRNYKDNSGNTQADFIPCVAWGKLADGIKESLAKSSRCTVEGKIQTGSYEGQDGKKVYTTELNVEFVEFLDPKPNRNQGQQEGGQPQQQFGGQPQQQFGGQPQQQFGGQPQQQWGGQPQQQFGGQPQQQWGGQPQQQWGSQPQQQWGGQPQQQGNGDGLPF
ncbi:single-stranded DNA-binding protein [Lysinibacillus fusiformis]|uniref:single-stranded DNA-binding protein n=1 Tax=Lysinibacillus fusiformis TaxID=28031 RepID=UPI003D05A237